MAASRSAPHLQPTALRRVPGTDGSPRPSPASPRPASTTARGALSFYSPWVSQQKINPARLPQILFKTVHDVKTQRHRMEPQDVQTLPPPLPGKNGTTKARASGQTIYAMAPRETRHRPSAGSRFCRLRPASDRPVKSPVPARFVRGIRAVPTLASAPKKCLADATLAQAPSFDRPNRDLVLAVGV